MCRLLVAMCMFISFISYGQLKVGDMAPDFSGKTLDKKEFSLSKALEAKQVIVINFWFAACAPCIKEIKHLRALKEKYKDNTNIRFIGLSIDNPKDMKALKKFLEVRDFPYEHIINSQSIAKLYNITAYPTNIVIGPDGKIVFITGSVDGIDVLDKVIESTIIK